MKRIIICIFACLFLNSCSESNKSDEGGIRLYYINTDETLIVSEPYEPKAEDTMGLIEELIEALNLPSENEKYKNAKPDAVAILDYSFEEGRRLIINFESTYYGLTGTTEILCRAAIVNTLSQIEGVELVEFYVRGQPLVLSGEVPVGLMSAADFIIAGGALMNHREEAQVTIYLTNEAGDTLIPYHLKTSYDGFISKEQLIVKLLLIGPKEDSGGYKTIPEKTKINKISVRDNICYIDLSSEFMEKRPGVSEEITIYSIVNSLIEQTSVTYVQFMINGEQKKNYNTIDFSGLFERNLALIETEY